MNTTTLSPEIIAEVKAGVAPILIGALCSVWLFGANTLQTWYYYQHYPGDRRTLKLLVTFVWVLVALHTVAVCDVIFFYFLDGIGNVAQIFHPTWGFATMVLLTGIIIITVHSFFAWRVYILSSRKRGIFIFLLVLAILHASSTWVVAGILFSLESNLNIPRAFRTTTIFSFSFNVATDCFLVGSLAYYLHQSRSGMITRIDRFVNKIIFWAINIGILTTITGFVVMVIVVTEEEPNQVSGVYQIIGNLYVASMLATLNHRPFTQQHLDEIGTSLVFASQRPTTHGVEIDITTNIMAEENTENQKVQDV